MSSLSVSVSRFLTVRLGMLLCALPLAHVVETMRPRPIQPLANVPDFVRGLAVIRSLPMPVVDLSLLLGSSPRDPNRFVVVKAGGRKIALAVEAVIGIHDAVPEKFSGLPPLLSKALPHAVASLGSLDHELLMVLQTTQLLPEEVWSLVAGVEEA